MHELTESELRKIKRRAERDSVTAALASLNEHAEVVIVAAFSDRNKLLSHVDTLQLERAELVELLRQIHEAANKVYQMGDATARTVLVNIYEISGKILTLASTTHQEYGQ